MTNPTNEHEQARELAQRIAEIHPPVDGQWLAAACPAWIASIAETISGLLSSRDAEIREVLEGLRRIRRDAQPCWCAIPAHDGHDPACLATQALYAKLQPDQINGASSTPKG